MADVDVGKQELLEAAGDVPAAEDAMRCHMESVLAEQEAVLRLLVAVTGAGMAAGPDGRVTGTTG